MALILTLLPMVLSGVIWIVGKRKDFYGYLLALFTTVLEFVLVLILIFSEPGDIEIPLVLNQGLHFTVDGFRKSYAFVISFMWMMTMLFSVEYFKAHGYSTRYFFFNIMTLGAIMGVFFSSDFFTALVFFEVMSFTSFTWVIEEETTDAIKAAGTYLAIAVIGGLAALMGLWLLNTAFHTLDFNQLFELAAEEHKTGYLYAAGICILAGFGAKAGMFPLHIWLPKAHPVAPAPASALLSGVLTKSGIFGVIAVSMSVFRYDHTWGVLIVVLGCITMFLGAVLALLSVNLKRTLACSSMSQIGFILIGIGTSCILKEESMLASGGTILHMVNHSLFKLVLFICAGTVYMNLHELDLNMIRGFGRGRILLMICFLLGAAGISGIPGLSGYISKTLLHEGIVEAAEEAGEWLRIVEWIFLFSGGLTLAYMTKLFVCIFVEKPDSKTHAFQKGHMEHRKSYIGVCGSLSLLIPALVIPVLGLSANFTMRNIAMASEAFLRTEPLKDMAYFSLTNLKGGGISILIGILVYLLFVRKVLIRNGRYVNILPEKLDLEELVYRPILLEFLPNVFGFIASVFGENRITARLFELLVTISGWISHIFADNVVTSRLYNGAVRLTEVMSHIFADNVVTSRLYNGAVRLTEIISHGFSDSIDGLILGLRKTIFKPVDSSVTMDKAETGLSYRTGSIIDRLRKPKDKKEKHKYGRLFYRSFRTLTWSIHNLSDTLSYSLLITVAAIVVILFYVVFVKG